MERDLVSFSCSEYHFHCSLIKLIKDESVIIGWSVFAPVEQGAELDNVKEDGDLRSRLIFKVGQLC